MSYGNLIALIDCDTVTKREKDFWLKQVFYFFLQEWNY